MVTKEKTEMKTLVSCMNSLQEKGYKENFVMDEKGLKGMESEKIYQPEDIKITDFYRFEGESDPGDNSILYAIESNDGTRGIIADAFGVYANPRLAAFLSNVTFREDGSLTDEGPNL